MFQFIQANAAQFLRPEFDIWDTQKNRRELTPKIVL